MKSTEAEVFLAKNKKCINIARIVTILVHSQILLTVVIFINHDQPRNELFNSPESFFSDCLVVYSVITQSTIVILSGVYVLLSARTLRSRNMQVSSFLLLKHAVSIFVPIWGIYYFWTRVVLEDSSGAAQ